MKPVRGIVNTGLTGYAERSRVAPGAGDSNRIPSVVYLKSQAPGTGTLQQSDETDPVSQSENYVSRIAGPSELKWSQKKMTDYEKLRDLRLKVANARHELLKKAIQDADTEVKTVVVENFKRILLPVLESVGVGFSARSNNNNNTENEIRNYLLLTAAPEEIAMVLPRRIVKDQIEPQVDKIREALFQDYSATVQN
jgi:hypothetical protein